METTEIKPLLGELRERIDKIENLLLADKKTEIVPGRWYWAWCGGIEPQYLMLFDRPSEISNFPYVSKIHFTKHIDGGFYPTCGRDGAFTKIGRPATREEIESALLPYLKENYPVGCTVKPVYAEGDGLWNLPHNQPDIPIVYDEHDDKAFRPGFNGLLYARGKFAEKVEEPKYDCKGLEVDVHANGALLNCKFFNWEQLKRLRDLLSSGLSVNDINRILKEKE